MNGKFYFFFFTLVSAFWGEIGVSYAREEPDAEMILRRYEQSVSYMQSVSMKVDVNARQLQPPERPDFTGYAEYHFVYRRDGKRCEWVGKSLGFDDKSELVNNNVIMHIFQADRYIHAIGPADGPADAVFLTRRFEGEQELQRDAPSLAGPLGGNIFGNNHKNVVQLLGDANDLGVCDNLEIVNGVPCYVLGATGKYGKVTAWIASERGHNAMKWVVEKSPHHLFDGERFSTRWPETKKWIAAFDLIETQKVGDRYLPKKALFTHTIEQKDGTRKVFGFDYEISDVRLNPDFVTLEAFRIDLPDGTRVYVEEAPGVKYVWQNGKIVPVEDVTFDEIDKMVEELKKGK